MENFVDFASGKQGRSLRIVVGAVVVMLGAAGTHGTAAWILGVIGTLLILSGVLKLCILNKLVGRKFDACPN
jgi:predicted phage tail protein